jgi:hypothetical protein
MTLPPWHVGMRVRLVRPDNAAHPWKGGVGEVVDLKEYPADPRWPDKGRPARILLWTRFRRAGWDDWREPTLAQRFAGFLALTALGFVHGWLVWIMFNAMVNDVAPESILDIGLFVWGMVLLQIVFAVAGVVALFLALAALGWVAWAVAERDRP